MQNLYAETTFDCPAYWMAEGFNMKDGQSYKYQVSIINSLHGEDETVYLNTFGSVNYLAPSFRDSFICKLSRGNEEVDVVRLLSRRYSNAR
jgi:hypothetical protein